MRPSCVKCVRSFLGFEENLNVFIVLVSWVWMDRERLWRESKILFLMCKGELVLLRNFKRFFENYFWKIVAETIFRYGQWRPIATPSPFLLKGARAKALSFAFLSLHLFLAIFARVQCRLPFSKFLTCSSLSLPFSVHRTCCISAPFSLPN